MAVVVAVDALAPRAAGDAVQQTLVITVLRWVLLATGVALLGWAALCGLGALVRRTSVAVRHVIGHGRRTIQVMTAAAAVPAVASGSAAAAATVEAPEPAPVDDAGAASTEPAPAEAGETGADETGANETEATRKAGTEDGATVPTAVMVPLSDVTVPPVTERLPDRIPAPGSPAVVGVVPPSGGPEEPSPGPDPQEAGTRWVVAPGEHFWSIAEAVTASDDEAVVAGYWRVLIDVNRSRLVVPGDPDVLLPGQVLTLPAAD